ncbi:hypothetical protein BC831DRAFT_462222 [Entophlyctis helioformis]|nr:hypothetical protein BC831DRAFT_462222 [Entophlyctis helioformis]
MVLENDSACCEHAHGSLGFAASSALAAAAGTADFVPANTTAKYGPDLVIEPVHLDIALDFALHDSAVHATVVQTFSNPHVANDLPGDLSLLRSIQLNATISLVWAAPFKPMEQRKVSFAYTVSRPTAGLYFDVPDAAYPSFPDKVMHAITDHEPERARYWLPVLDLPAVRTSLAFAITAPAAYMAIANGALVSETLNANGTKTTKYRLDHLCPSYLICVAVGDFVTIDDEAVRDIPIKYIAPKGYNADDLKSTFGRTPAMIRWLEKKLDYPFPWPKYFQICSKFIGGAMENISLVTWRDRYILDPKLAQEMGIHVDGTNIHEMAHTYFGDLLVIRHFEHVWLKESWATYTVALAEDNVSQDEFRYEMWWNADRYIGETASYMRPIVTRQYDSSWRMFDWHTYPGGACRIHMIRRHVGDQAFFRGVQRYVKTFAGKTVETEDFRKCIEAESGINLVPFFDQWLYSKGFPKLKGTFEYKPSQPYVVVTLEQTQIDAKAAVPFFTITIDVEVVDADGKTFAGQVVFSNPTQTKAFAMIPIGSAKPKVLRFDPTGRILFSIDCNPGEDILAGTARMPLMSPTASGPTCSGRDAKLRAALRQFVERADAPTSARADALDNLGAQRNHDDVAYLLAVAQDAKQIGIHAMTRSGALRGLGASRDPAAYAYLLTRTAAGVEPQYARPVVFTAIAASAPWQTPQSLRSAIELFEDGLRDSDLAVQFACARSLVALESKASAGALTSLANILDERDATSVRRLVRRLREAGGVGPGIGGEKAKEVYALVETLEAKLKKLEEAERVREAREEAVKEAVAAAAADKAKAAAAATEAKL